MKKRVEWAESMNPCPVWNEGSDSQQEFADELVENFCIDLAKHFCWAVRDNIIEIDDIDSLVNIIFDSINNIDDAKWWCNKKISDDFSIALKLLNDYELGTDIIKKIKKEYA